jgi:hypothetical protein
VVDNLKTILAPTLCVPHTAQKLHEYLGYEGQLRCNASGTQHVVEYEEETRSHQTLPTTTAARWGRGRPAPCRRGRRCGSRRRSLRSWMRA